MREKINIRNPVPVREYQDVTLLGGRRRAVPLRSRDELSSSTICVNDELGYIHDCAWVKEGWRHRCWLYT